MLSLRLQVCSHSRLYVSDAAVAASSQQLLEARADANALRSQLHSPPAVQAVDPRPAEGR